MTIIHDQICYNCSQEKEDVQPRKTCRYCNPTKHIFCNDCDVIIHAGLEEDDLYMECDYILCGKEATHKNVMNSGDVYNMCDDHFDLVGEYK